MSGRAIRYSEQRYVKEAERSDGTSLAARTRLVVSQTDHYRQDHRGEETGHGYFILG